MESRWVRGGDLATKGVDEEWWTKKFMSDRAGIYNVKAACTSLPCLPSSDVLPQRSQAVTVECHTTCVDLHFYSTRPDAYIGWN
jgi:hypothetical protein